MKKRLLCPSLPKRGISVPLPENEAHHATRVLRLKDGDIIEAIDGKGNWVMATLRLKGGPIRLEFLESEKPTLLIDSRQKPLPLTLEMSVLKGEAMEWVVEKAVELGIQQFVPVLTAYTVVQMKSKSPESFRERWQKIADQALKQCGRLDRMEIALPCSLEDLLKKTAQNPNAIRLWCDETSRDNAPYLMNWLQTCSVKDSSEWRLLIGPEGGWSPAERTILQQESLNSVIQRIHLGPLILRAETAGLFSASIVTAYLRT
jgi:16S rRNA (uracil1498-N3)-methyltransferase